MDDVVERLATDQTHGSTHLSLVALDGLRERAEQADDYEQVAALARDLRTVRPAMHAIANRVNRAIADAARTPAAVAARAATLREQAAEADETAADRAAARLDGGRVLTLSRSGTVRKTLSRAAPEQVYVLESRPGGEGVDVAETVAEELPAAAVTLAPDSTVADLLAREPVDTVLVGADAVHPDGSVINKVGTRTAATVARQTDIDMLVVCAAAKIAPAGTDEYHREPQDSTALYDGPAEVAVHAPTFDRTPAELVNTLVTEQGPLTVADVQAVADEHAAAAKWAN